MRIKRFSTTHVLGVITGVDCSPAIGARHNLLSFMIGRQFSNGLFAQFAQMGVVEEPCAEALRAQHPRLRNVDTPTQEVGARVIWLEEQLQILGHTLWVTRLSTAQLTQINDFERMFASSLPYEG